jgi:hypothetical protein
LETISERKTWKILKRHFVHKGIRKVDAVAAASLAGRPAFQKAKTLSRWVYRRRAHQ